MLNDTVSPGDRDAAAPAGGAEYLGESRGALPLSTSPAAHSPSIADGVERRLDRGWIVAEQLRRGVAALFSVIFYLGAAWAMTRFDWPFRGRFESAIWGVAGSWVAWRLARALAWPPMAWRHAAYRVDPEGIEIRRGVFWRTIITVPRSRVQHTDVSQGPFERRFGLGTLAIYTAGTAHARVDLDGLAHETALAIRDHLLPRQGHDVV